MSGTVMLMLVGRRARCLGKTRLSRIAQPVAQGLTQVAHLLLLRAIGPNCAWVWEFCAWRGFRNRRELASLAGMCGTPYDSGESKCEQGIFKARNRRNPACDFHRTGLSSVMV
ncbi:MAG: transposase [Pyrinomonadaceae bacterium]|nr:transposase [Pyrinomonadaceae bacterium]